MPPAQVPDAALEPWMGPVEDAEAEQTLQGLMLVLMDAMEHHGMVEGVVAPCGRMLRRAALWTAGAGATDARAPLAGRLRRAARAPAPAPGAADVLRALSRAARAPVLLLRACDALDPRLRQVPGRKDLLRRAAAARRRTAPTAAALLQSRGRYEPGAVPPAHAALPTGAGRPGGRLTAADLLGTERAATLGLMPVQILARAGLRADVRTARASDGRLTAAPATAFGSDAPIGAEEAAGEADTGTSVSACVLFGQIPGALEALLREGEPRAA